MNANKDIQKIDTPVKEKSGISYWELALEAVVAATPIIGPSAAALIRASNESKRASESNDINILNDEAEKQRVELLMAEMQARVAQEMAIAQRIQSAHEVEIEEYYECELRVENRCQHQHCGSQFSEDVNKESLR